MTKTDRELLRSYTARKNQPRAGNCQWWKVTRNTDGFEAVVVVHAMAGPTTAIQKAIRQNEWLPASDEPSHIGLHEEER